MTRSSDPVPKPRSGHRIVNDSEGNVFSIGGYNPSIDSDEEDVDEELRNSKPLFKELWKFSPTTKTWTKIRTTGSIPDHLASHCAAFFNDQLLVFGGTGVPFGHTSNNLVYSCDLKSYKWNLLKATNPGDDSNLPPDGYGQGLVVDPDEECLYVSCQSEHLFSCIFHHFLLFSIIFSPFSSFPTRFSGRRWNKWISVFNRCAQILSEESEME